MEHLLSDTSKFEIIEDLSVELIAKTEESFNYLLKNLTHIEENYRVLDEQGKPFKPF